MAQEPCIRSRLYGGNSSRFIAGLTQGAGKRELAGTRGGMKDYDVVLSGEAREFLLGLDREEREQLTQAMFDELRPDIPPAIPVTGRLMLRQIYGYRVYYRNLNEKEKRGFDLRNGRLVVQIKLITRNLWSWLR
jgi:hypothetical protein